LCGAADILHFDENTARIYLMETEQQSRQTRKKSGKDLAEKKNRLAG
jgi:hypothetical protein